MKTKMISMIAALAAFASFGVTPNTDFQDIPGTYKLGEVISAGGAVTSETDPTVPSWAKEATPPTTMTTNAVRDIANATIATNALTVATTNRVAVLEHSKADKSALCDKRDKTDLAVYEEQFSAWTHGELPRPTFVLETDQPTWYVPTEGEPDPTPYWKWRAHDEVDYSEFRLYASTNTEGGTFVWYVDRRPQEETLHAIRVKSIDPTSDTLATSNEVAAAISANEKTGTNEQVVRGELWQDYMWLIEVENADFARLALADEEGHNIIDTYATKSEVDDKADRATTLLGYGITDATPLSMISADDSTFSNAVLAVGLNIDTNSVAVLNEIASTFGGFPLGGTATTVGGLLAALAAAIAWLKKNKVQTLKLENGSVETSADGGVAKLDDFFTESNSLLNGRLAYSRNATGLKDRAFNTLSFDGTEFNLSTALEGVTPTASGQPRDLLIVATATAATTISFTAGTIKGDKPTIDGSGTWLITLTEYASGVWYCRQIKMEDAA